MPLRCISVDLDSLPHYCRIQGLDEGLLDEPARELVWRVAIPRYLDLFAQCGVPATFFVIGADVAATGCAQALVTADRAGVELASHSYSHDYALSRLPEAEAAADLRRAHEAIVEATGVAPVGFRAPGYTLSKALLKAIASMGYAYDSSTFPAAPYYLAKATVMAGLALVGRPSRAILDVPAVLTAPLTPYRPSLDRPYRKGDAPFVELPVAVSPVMRLPFIGTLVTSAPPAVVSAAWRSVAKGFVNFELHAIDVLDQSDGVPAPLVRQQRDLKVPASVKLERLGRLFRQMRDTGECITLKEAASRLKP